MLIMHYAKDNFMRGEIKSMQGQIENVKLYELYDFFQILQCLVQSDLMWVESHLTQNHLA